MENYNLTEQKYDYHLMRMFQMFFEEIKIYEKSKGDEEWIEKNMKKINFLEKSKK